MAPPSLKPRGKAHLLALEPRMMFDAAAGAVAQDAVLGDGDHAAHPPVFADAHDRAPASRPTEATMGFHDSRAVDAEGPRAADRSAAALTGTSAGAHDVIFIDTAVPDYQTLAAEWAGRGDVILIDSTRDGIDQVRAALAGERDVAAIHIVSHGSEGVLYLGTTRIDAAAIQGDLSASLGAIGRSLNPGGDILLYGCDFAEGTDGAQALAAFAQATHADVAASTDRTGYAPLGGDWTLEAHDGAIQAHTLSSDDWAHVLDPNVFVPIAVTPDSLTVTDASGKVVTSGSTGYVTNSTADSTERSTNVGAKAVARWSGAATLADGTKVDLLATVVSISTGDSVQFNRPTSTGTGDDPTFLLRDLSNGNARNGDGASVQILWQLVLSGTTTPIAANVEFGILDIDGVAGKTNGREAVSVPTDNLAYYTAERTSDIAIDATLGRVTAAGTQNENTDATKPLDTKSEVTFDWTKVSSFTINYSLAANNGVTTQAQFYQDGNADFKYSDPVYVSIPRLDLDANDSTATGNDAHFVFTTGGADSPIVDTDVRVSNPMDVNAVASASVVLTNAKAGDALHVGTLPSNITASVTNGSGTITVALSGAGSEADYDAALRAITFANAAASPDTTQRVIDVSFSNGKLSSAVAVSRIDINHAPVANTDSVTTAEDTAATVAVLRNDTDADGDALTVTGASATHGRVAINADGTLTYTPDANYNGPDSIAYTIADGRGGTAASSVAVTVTPVNDPPQDVGTLPAQASQDASTVSYATAGGFSDVDGDRLTYSATGLPTGLTIDASTGVISGTIDRSASQTNGGTYMVAVTATDPSNTSATQDFTLTVTNPPPVAADDSATTPEDTAVVIPVLANDRDPDGDPLSVTSASAAHGSVAINPDGTLTYTPSANYNGSDSIAYTISDGQGGTASARVAVTVTPVNDAPQDVGTLPAQASQDAATVSYATASGFGDVDGDRLTYSATGLPTGLTIDASTGVISGTIDRSASQTNGGSYAVAVTATDPSNASATQYFTLTVTNPPPVAVDDSATTHGTVVIPVLANAHDPDGDPLTVTSASAQHGTATINADGTLAYTPAAGFAGTDRVAYTISDGQGGTASAVATVTVTNAAPTHSAIDPQAASDAQAVSLAAGAHFADADGDTLAYSATGLPQGLTIDPATGMISGTIDRSASQANGGIYDAVVTVTDGHGGRDTASVRWTVTNPAPVAADDSATTSEGAVVVIPVLANDRDPDGDPLTVTSASAQHGSVAINADGTLTYTPNADYQGQDSIAYTISDGQGGTASAQVTVTVTPVNHPPQDVGTLPAQASQDGATVSYATAGAFGDADSDALTYSAKRLPAGLSIDASTGVISGTIDRSASQANGGRYEVAVTATDPSNAAATQYFTLTVTNPPPIAADDSATTPEDTAVVIPVLANDHDPDGDPLTVTSASAAHGSIAINADGTLTYTPNADYNGSDSIAYTIADAQGGTSSAHVAVTITPVNDRPRDVGTLPAQALQDGATVSYATAGGFGDTDGDRLTYSATGLPKGLTINPQTGVISGRIDRSASQTNGGTYAVAVTATAPSNTSATQDFTLTVTNPPPAAADDSATTPEDIAVVIPVLANDRDPDGDPLTVTSASAQHGSVAINADGTLTYTPGVDYNGSDSIAYTISDGQGGTASAHVAVTVTPVNDAPHDVGTLPAQASRDAATVSYATAVGFGDADADRLTYSVTGLPTGLTIDASTGVISGTIDRSASQANSGVYAVAVTATDPSGASATQGFALTVDNPPPVAADDNATTPEDTAVVITVLANDRDPDGDPLTVTSASAAHGSVAINADGTLTYTPGANYNGSDSIAYTISDGQGGTASAHVAVTVTPVNDAPTGQPIAARAASDSQAVALEVGGFFGDVDGDALAYSATGLPPGLTIDPATGRIAGTIDHAASRGGVYHVTVTATDPAGTSASSAFDWTIANPAPVAADDAATLAQDTRVVIPVLANDRDPDGDPLAVTSASAGHGSVAINADGTLVYQPAAGFRGNDVIVYTVADGDGGTASASVLVTVTPVDHAPEAFVATPPAVAAIEGRSVGIDAAPWFRDADGDALTYSATGLPKGLAIDPATGRISGAVDRSATVQAPGADGRYAVTVTATDPGGLAAQATFALQTADPAPIVTDSSARTREDTGIVLPALANVRDPDGDPLTVTAASAQHGTVTVNPDGTIAYVPGALFSGTDTVRYTVTDSDGASATAVVTVTVDHVNHPPVVPQQGAPIEAVGGRPVRIDALAGVTDVDGDRPTIVQASSANGQVRVDADGTIRFVPDLGFVGTTTITYVVADGQGGFTTATLVVRVADGRGADIEQLLRIGRVSFVDPTPGFARIVVPDGIVRNPLTILDTVESIRTLNTTAIGRQPVGDAGEAIRTLDGTYVDPDQPVLAEVARLDALRDQRDAGDRLFDHRWGDFLVKGASGFSAASDAGACIMVESVVRGGAIYLEVRDTAGERGAPIRSVDVRTAGGARPDWLRVDHRGLAIVERGADMDELHLIVRVTRTNGHVSTTPIVVQGATGEVELDRRHHAHAHPPGRAAPLDATLADRHHAARANAARIDRIFQ